MAAVGMKKEAVQADKQLQLLLRTATNLGAQQVQPPVPCEIL